MTELSPTDPPATYSDTRLPVGSAATAQSPHLVSFQRCRGSRGSSIGVLGASCARFLVAPAWPPNPQSEPHGPQNRFAGYPDQPLARCVAIGSNIATFRASVTAGSPPVTRLTARCIQISTRGISSHSLPMGRLVGRVHTRSAGHPPHTFKRASLQTRPQSSGRYGLNCHLLNRKRFNSHS